MDERLITTSKKECVGCNKCIAKCPTRANESIVAENNNRVIINPERCIDCGECIHVCDHGARQFIDDTELFFDALTKGEKISIIVAPAIRNNFIKYQNLFGFLKSRGVTLIYDVSFGADITTWAYLKTIRENKLTSIIAQPCPVVVSYIERFKPSLLQNLAPIHSPALCTAIYLNHYKSSTDKIAFLSPCIAKSIEFNDPNTNGLVSYNVTYAKLEEYLKNNHIDLRSYPETDFDNMDGSIGLTFSRPGGLKENVYFHSGEDVWVKQIEGMDNVKKYLDEYETRLNLNKPRPLLVDVLNCEYGCNFGTGTSNKMDIDDADYKTNSLKKQATKEAGETLFSYFDNELQLSDFIRTYHDKSDTIPVEMEHDVESVFLKLGKVTEESRKINCFSCGYGSCQQFALSVSNGHNRIDNCIYYARNALNNSLTEFDNLFDALNVKINETNSDLKNLHKSSSQLKEITMYTKIISINASIEAAHARESGASFAVVASEMRDLSDKSSNVIHETFENTKNIETSVEHLKQALDDIRLQMHSLLQAQTSEKI